MGKHAGGGAVAGKFQHGRPEKGMEIENIFADKVIQLGFAIGFEKFIKIHADALAQVFKRGHIAHRRIEPHIKIFARRIGDFKAEIGRIARNIPIAQAAFAVFIGYKPFFHFVERFGLQMRLHAAIGQGGAAGSPFLQVIDAIAELEEEMFALFEHRCGAGNGRIGVD